MLVAPYVNADETLFMAEYKGKYSGMTITSKRTLTAKDNGTLQIESRIKNILGSITEKSTFSINEGILTPTLYRYNRNLLGFSANEKITFNWAEATAQYERKDKPEKNKSHTLEQGVLDPALYQLQLQREVQAGVKAFRVSFAKPSKIKTLLFHQTAEETLNVAGKSYPSIKLERINLDDTKKTRIWVIPKLNYQIGRIEHIEEDGESYNIYLTRYKASANLAKTLYTPSTPTAAPNNPP